MDSKIWREHISYLMFQLHYTRFFMKHFAVFFDLCHSCPVRLHFDIHHPNSTLSHAKVGVGCLHVDLHSTSAVRRVAWLRDEPRCACLRFQFVILQSGILFLLLFQLISYSFQLLKSFIRRGFCIYSCVMSSFVRRLREACGKPISCILTS